MTERQTLIENLDQDLNEGVPEDDLLQSYLDSDRNGARPSFAHVAIGYLKVQAAALDRSPGRIAKQGTVPWNASQPPRLRTETGPNGGISGRESR